ncbi:hypothetical protein Mag101_11415 [Microbulbifer agarilyticus]|uniref:Uncharacterized protein n=1 Tax=Microbulbifer agarilyticus TaxID=260552 RepID=A0A1Q2M7A4_9GAMM|nr:hypothetical protein [Microbulbifer agarilyticus]AQQ68177.1 hypothetical protein Mag101_11415 [Microbulbifer agarilyticus]
MNEILALFGPFFVGLFIYIKEFGLSWAQVKQDFGIVELFATAVMIGSTVYLFTHIERYDCESCMRSPYMRSLFEIGFGYAATQFHVAFSGMVFDDLASRMKSAVIAILGWGVMLFGMFTLHGYLS